MSERSESSSDNTTGTAGWLRDFDPALLGTILLYAILSALFLTDQWITHVLDNLLNIQNSATQVRDSTLVIGIFAILTFILFWDRSAKKTKNALDETRNLYALLKSLTENAIEETRNQHVNLTSLLQSVLSRSDTVVFPDEDSWNAFRLAIINNIHSSTDRQNTKQILASTALRETFQPEYFRALIKLIATEGVGKGRIFLHADQNNLEQTISLNAELESRSKIIQDVEHELSIAIPDTKIEIYHYDRDNQYATADFLVIGQHIFVSLHRHDGDSSWSMRIYLCHEGIAEGIWQTFEKKLDDRDHCSRYPKLFLP